MALQSIFHCAEKAAELIDGLDYSDVIDDVISVALSSDFKFHKYACVTIASLLTNYKGSKPLCVYLLIDKELAREDAENFAALQDIHPFEFRPIVVDGTKYQNVRITLGITVATYYRLKLHEVLPSSCNKVIYLDSDLIVLHCLSDLYHIDLGRSIVGGVEDSISKIFVDRFTQHPQVEHFNAGVLLINLRKLRDINFTDIANEYIDYQKYTILLGDQQIFTSILGLRSLKLPIKWNVHGSMFDDNWMERHVGIFNAMDECDCRAAINDPAVIHYTFKSKPWLSRDHPRSDDWFHYAARTNYKIASGNQKERS